MIKAVLSLFLLLLLPTADCFSQGAWAQKADFGGGRITRATGFSIGNKGYIVTGADSTGFTPSFWEYDPSNDTWTQRVDFAGTPRSNATGFSIGTNGFYGTGNAGTTYYNDFWMYDALLNQWFQKANFPGAPRFYATGFSAGGKGYLGTGLTGPNGTDAQNDFYEYTVATDSWSLITFPGVQRGPGVGFSIGTKGYFGTGNGTNNFPTSDFWELEPSNNAWTQKADLPQQKCGAVGFSIGNRGYIGTGQEDSIPYSKNFWEYDPIFNSWTQKPDCGGVPRRHAVGISINGKGYIGTGSFGANKDWWEYDPSAVGINDASMLLGKTVSVFPNPMKEYSILKIQDSRFKGVTFELLDITGKCVKQFSILNPESVINKDDLAPGIYFYKLTSENEHFASGKLIIQ